jgi:hypothetical protein
MVVAVVLRKRHSSMPMPMVVAVVKRPLSNPPRIDEQSCEIRPPFVALVQPTASWTFSYSNSNVAGFVVLVERNSFA